MNEEIRTLVRYRLERAFETIEEARLLLAGGHPTPMSTGFTERRRGRVLRRDKNVTVNSGVTTLTRYGAATTLKSILQ